MPGSLLGTEVVRVEDPELLAGPRHVHRQPGRQHGGARAAPPRPSCARRTPTPVDRDVDALGRRSPCRAWSAALVNADLGVPSFHSFGVALNEACARPPLADGQGPLRGRPRGRRGGARPQPRRPTPRDAVVVDYEPLPAVVDPEAALAPGAPVQFDELGSNLAAGLRDADDGRPARRRRRRRAGPLRQPAHRRGADGGQRHRRHPRDDEPGHELTVYVSTQMPHLVPAAGLPPARTPRGGDAGHHPPRRRRLRRQGRDHRRARGRTAAARRLGAR